MAKSTAPALSPEAARLAAIRTAVVKSSHPTANIFPMMSDDELENLCISMRQTGFDPSHPIKKLEGQITDGRNRETAAQVVNSEIAAWNADPANASDQKVLIKPVYVEESSANASLILQGVFRDNFVRRQMSSSQKAAVVVKAGIMSAVYGKKAELGAEGKKIAGEFADFVAKQIGTNSDYIYKLRAIVKANAKGLGRVMLEKVANGEISVMEAHKEANKVPAGDGKPGDVNNGGQASPDAVLDGKKNEVPEDFKPIFQVGGIYAAAAALLTDLKKKVTEIAAHAGGKMLAEGNNVKEVNALIGNIAKALKATKPYIVCPHCEGDGKHPEKPGVVCPCCFGVTTVTQAQAESFEKHGVIDSDEAADPDAAPAVEAPAPKAKKGKKAAPAVEAAAETPAEEPAVV